MRLSPRVLAKHPAAMTPRIAADVVIFVCLFGAGVFARAFAEAAAQTSFGVALVNQLPAILTSAAALIVGVWTLVRQGKTHAVAAEVKAETAEIKKDVNSQFSALKAELAQSKAETSALRQVIAGKPGATSEELMRAVISKEQQAQPAPLPKDTPLPGGSP